jgi:hypothetical protein
MRDPAGISIDEILCAVARQAGVAPASIVGPGEPGENPLNWPRQRFCMLVRRIRPDLTWVQISRLMGGRDWTTLGAASRQGEARFAAGAVERLAVRAVLGALRLDDLPSFSLDARRRHKLDVQISATRRHLAALLKQRLAMGHGA